MTAEWCDAKRFEYYLSTIWVQIWVRHELPAGLRGSFSPGSLSGVTLGMGAPLPAPPSPIWRPLSPQEAVWLHGSLKINSRQNSENDDENLKKMYISSLKRVLLLVLQLSFRKNVPHFRAILRPPETAPPCSAGSAGPIVTPLLLWPVFYTS